MGDYSRNPYVIMLPSTKQSLENPPGIWQRSAAEQKGSHYYRSTIMQQLSENEKNRQINREAITS
ncbi:MAG: hypothetical protein M0O96_11500, partial [Desulforhopalus sp.]|nr:hypothetical protein [Desulforhopalus sp.]